MVSAIAFAFVLFQSGIEPPVMPESITLTLQNMESCGPGYGILNGTYTLVRRPGPTDPEPTFDPYSRRAWAKGPGGVPVKVYAVMWRYEHFGLPTTTTNLGIVVELPVGNHPQWTKSVEGPVCPVSGTPTLSPWSIPPAARLNPPRCIVQ